ncbi:MAG: isopentenyl phosphate kinase [Candidatus Heimdallarchaeota archaeon]
MENNDWMREIELTRKNEIFLLKLGGGLLTDKNKPFFIREEIVRSAVQQIVEANEKLILIHGGGSFGHPLAKKYCISKGLNVSIPNQIFGLTETHQAMIKFNSYLVNLFMDNNYPSLSFQPSSIFIKDSHKIISSPFEIIETALGLSILPILYGDIILDKTGTFSIISGDDIIYELCENLVKYRISKVIFATETDGIYLNKKENEDMNIVLANELNSSDLDSLDLADLGKKIDVTGGIEGKLESIKKICKYKIPVQLINGLKEGFIFKALKNEKVNCTYIKVS